VKLKRWAHCTTIAHTIPAMRRSPSIILTINRQDYLTSTVSSTIAAINRRRKEL
jgi:hypothetical protein